MYEFNSLEALFLHEKKFLEARLLEFKTEEA